LGLLLASAWLLPELLSGAGDAWRWFGREESFQASVAESQPLFSDRHRLSLGVANSRLSLFIYLFPLILIAAAHSVWRQKQRAHVFLLLGWSVGLLVVTLFQRRFFNSLSIPLALMAAWGVCHLYRVLVASFPELTARRRLVQAALGVAVVVFLLPTFKAYRIHLANEFRAARGEIIEVSPTFARRRALVDAALWLRRSTPRTSGWRTDDGRPEYGVIGPWPTGHVIEYAARRPTVTDNFGDDIGEENFLSARRYFRSAEPEAAALLEKLKVRYVIAQQRHEFLGDRPPEDSMFRALYFRDGSEFVPASEDEGLQPVGALERHRLVFESRPLRKRELDSASVYKIFEFVPGATVAGSAAAGALVRASLTLRTNRGREILYAARIVAGEDGRYALRVPYANLGGPGAVEVAEHYWFECGGQGTAVRVEEDAVARGAEVAGPELCAPGAP
jgi:asparagine N-glycosylation enzyme membrane subunit Stt3